MGKLVLTMRDGQNTPKQTSLARFPHADMVGDVTATIGLQNSLRDAVKGISWAQTIKTTRVASDADHIDVPAGDASADASSNAFARREAKWLVYYHDSITGKGLKLEVPCPNMNLLDSTGAYLDLAGAPGTAFKAAFEALVIGPSGNASVVDFVKFVGRNL